MKKVKAVEMYKKGIEIAKKRYYRYKKLIKCFEELIKMNCDYFH
jgi:ACT domain-containing protein